MIKYSLSEPFIYQNDYEYGFNNCISFWDDVAKKYIKWDKVYNNIWSGNEYKPEWFKDGLLNACYNSLDINILNEERKNQIAYIHECPIKNVVNTITYLELWNKVCVFSRVLKNLGIGKGDLVLIYMPTIIEAAIAMLSCARIGAIHCVTFAGFSSFNLAFRLNYLKPKLIITTNCGIQIGSCGIDNGIGSDELICYLQIINDSIIQSNYKPNYVVCYKRNDIIGSTSSLDIFNQYKEKIINLLDWDILINTVDKPYYEYELVESNHPLYILYTSGTTGQPKPLVFNTVGVIIQCYYYLKMNYKINCGQVLFSTSDIGWVLGHNVNVYGSLINGSTSIFFEGDITLPTPDIIFHICSKYNVQSLFTIPSEIRLIRKLDINNLIIKKYGNSNNLKSLKAITTCGETIDQSTFNYISNLNIPIYDLYGSTETAGGIISYCGSSSTTTTTTTTFNFKLNSAGKPVPGIIFKIKPSSSSSKTTTLNDNSRKELIGELLIKLPLPPFICQCIYNDQDQFNERYLNKFQGYYRTSDLAYKDNDGYYYLVSRSDDVINIDGDTIYINHLENIILKNSKVIDCSIIAVKNEILGQVPLALLVLNKDYYQDPFNLTTNQLNQLKDEINKSIINEITVSSTIKHLIIVSTTLKNKSKKKIKYCLSNIFNGESYSIPSTISNINEFYQLKDIIINYKNNNKQIINQN